MVNCVVQHLTTGSTFSISCMSYIQKVSVFKKKLAIQTLDSILIYQLTENGREISYVKKETIPMKIDCNLLVITSQHVTFCIEKKLSSISYKGEKEREWHFDTSIRYIKVVGGAPGNEGLVVGFKDGSVYQVYLSNPFPILLIKISHAVRCVDISRNRKKIAIIDDQGLCKVYDLAQKTLLYEEQNATSLAWNVDHEDMLCYSGHGYLYTKVAMFPAYRKKLTGFVVGFKGSKVYCLNGLTMNAFDVPQSSSMHLYLGKCDFLLAYLTACLGVTDIDWKLLAVNSLEACNLDISKKAYAQIRDLKMINFMYVFFPLI